MLTETMKVANSFGMWIACGIMMSVVAVQAVMFFSLANKEAKKINFDKKLVIKSFKSGMITALGPSVAQFVALVSFIAVIGSPMAWENLSIIGSASTDLTVANIAAESAGSVLGDANFGLKSLAIVAFCLAVNGAMWHVVVIATTKSMNSIRNKLGGGDEKWIKLISMAASVGVFCDMAAGQAVKGGPALVAVIAGIAFMLIAMQLANKIKALREYKLAISIICGLVCAGIASTIM